MRHLSTCSLVDGLTSLSLKMEHGPCQKQLIAKFGWKSEPELKNFPRLWPISVEAA